MLVGVPTESLMVPSATRCVQDLSSCRRCSFELKALLRDYRSSRRACWGKGGGVENATLPSAPNQKSPP